MAADATRYAVLDGASGTQWVRVPRDLEQARRLRAMHRTRESSGFWCSTAAGGCGTELSLHAGEVRERYFAHLPGRGEDCPFRHDPDLIEQSYLHLALQRALQEWLRCLGYDGVLEERLRHGGRADLAVRAAAGGKPVPSGSQTIEVQLSSLTEEEHGRRDDRYHQDVNVVSWLAGVRVPDVLTNALVDRCGYALRIRLDPELDEPEHLRLIDAIQVGTQTSAGPILWTPLTHCGLDEHGVSTPHTQAAREAYASRAAAALAQMHQAEEARRATVIRSAQSVSHGRSPNTSFGARSDEPLFREKTSLVHGVQAVTAPMMIPPRGHSRHPLAAHDYMAVDLTDIDTRWSALPQHLRRAAAVMAHIVTAIDENGPDWMLSFPDVEDGTRIQEALIEAGLVELYEGSRGVTRWRRLSSG